MSQDNTPNTPNHSILVHYGEIARKGFPTAQNPKIRAERVSKFLALVDNAIGPNVDRKFAEAQFEGSTGEIYTTTIYPSGKFFCGCQARGICKHVTALAKIGHTKYDDRPQAQ